MPSERDKVSENPYESPLGNITSKSPLPRVLKGVLALIGGVTAGCVLGELILLMHVWKAL